MNIAPFRATGTWAPFQGWWRRIAPFSEQHAPVTGLQPCLIEPVQHRPLRIVRVVEAGQTPSQVGRMVISGRMADVCAELDRLAAREAALH